MIMSCLFVTHNMDMNLYTLFPLMSELRPWGKSNKFFKCDTFINYNITVLMHMFLPLYIIVCTWCWCMYRGYQLRYMFVKISQFWKILFLVYDFSIWTRVKMHRYFSYPMWVYTYNISFCIQCIHPIPIKIV